MYQKPSQLYRLFGLVSFCFVASVSLLAWKVSGQSCANFFAIFTEGEYPSETSWHILDSHGDQLSDCSGNAGSPLQTTCCFVPGDTYTIVCEDSFGDGWQGSSVSLGYGSPTTQNSLTLCTEEFEDTHTQNFGVPELSHFDATSAPSTGSYDGYSGYGAYDSYSDDSSGYTGYTGGSSEVQNAACSDKNEKVEVESAGDYVDCDDVRDRGFCSTMSYVAIVLCPVSCQVYTPSADSEHDVTAQSFQPCTVFSVTFGGGIKPEEASWIIRSESNEVVCSGEGGSHTHFSCCLVPEENYTISCFDEGGDGWNGNYINVGGSTALCANQAGQSHNETFRVTCISSQGISMLPINDERFCYLHDILVVSSGDYVHIQRRDSSPSPLATRISGHMRVYGNLTVEDINLECQCHRTDSGLQLEENSWASLLRTEIRHCRGRSAVVVKTASMLLLENVSIVDNNAMNPNELVGLVYGGGILATGGGGILVRGNVKITDCVADYGGGLALLGVGTELTVEISEQYPSTTLTFSRNRAYQSGGAIAMFDGSSLRVRNESRVTGIDNIADNGLGGGLYASGHNTLVEIRGNEASVEFEATSGTKPVALFYSAQLRLADGGTSSHNSTNATSSWCKLKLSNGIDHILNPGEVCQLQIPVIIGSGHVLLVRTQHGSLADNYSEYGGGNSNMAVISGGNTTNLFVVEGRITLVSLVLKHGHFSMLHTMGGCLQIKSLTESIALAHLIDVVMRGCHGVEASTDGRRLLETTSDFKHSTSRSKTEINHFRKSEFRHRNGRSMFLKMASQHRRNLISPSSSPSDTFEPFDIFACSDGEIIEFSKVNNGAADCNDQSDESRDMIPYFETVSKGGAIAIDGRMAYLILEGSTTIESNTADEGGAIYAASGAHVLVGRPSTTSQMCASLPCHDIINVSQSNAVAIQGNVAWSGTGGGISLLSACTGTSSTLLKCSECGVECWINYTAYCMCDDEINSISREWINDGMADCLSGEDEGVPEGASPQQQICILDSDAPPSSLTLHGINTKLFIHDNTAQSGRCGLGIGGGLYAYGSSILIQGEDSVLNISENKAVYGAGLAIHSGHVEIHSGRCHIQNNRAGAEAGGLALSRTNLTLHGINTALLIDANMASGGSAGGVGLWGNSTLNVYGGAFANVSRNVATAEVQSDLIQQAGAGIRMLQKGSVHVSDSGTNLYVSQNLALVGSGGGIAFESGSRFLITNGASVQVISNNASSDGGGVSLKDNGLWDEGQATMRVHGRNTRIFVKGNNALGGSGGGIFCVGAISLGAYAQVSQNNAAFDGGGIYLHFAQGVSESTMPGGSRYVEYHDTPSTMHVADESQLVISENKAYYGDGGGISALGSYVLIDFGGQLHISKNQAGRNGGGIFLISGNLNSMLQPKVKQKHGGFHVHGDSYRKEILNMSEPALVVNENRALEGGGGGIAIVPGASVLVSNAYLFKENSAPIGDGGAVGYVNVADYQINLFRDTSCVPITLRMKMALTNLLAHYLSSSENQAFIHVYTIPQSPLRSDDLIDEIPLNHFNSFYNPSDEFIEWTTNWCVPCGDYELYITTNTQETPFYAGKDGKVVVALTEHPETIIAELGPWAPVTTLAVPCFGQSARFLNENHETTNKTRTSLFMDNSANRGGACSAATQNAFFIIKGASFIGNSAKQGGAMYASGDTLTGISCSSRCKFDANTAIGGCGGGIAIEDKAKLFLSHTLASDNTATYGDGINAINCAGNGGFIYVRNANSVLLKNLSIVRGRADKHGGGLAIYGEFARVGCDSVSIKECIAGDGGGAALAVLDNAEVHLAGTCNLHNNSVNGLGSGGHGMVSGDAKLIIHGVGEVVHWPKVTPTTPSPSWLGLPERVEEHFGLFDFGSGCKNNTPLGEWSDIHNEIDCEAAAWLLLGDDLVVKSVIAPSNLEGLQLMKTLDSIRDEPCVDMPLTHPKYPACQFFIQSTYGPFAAASNMNCTYEYFMDMLERPDFEFDYFDPPEEADEFAELAANCPVSCGQCDQEQMEDAVETEHMGPKRCYVTMSGFPNGDVAIPLEDNDLILRQPVFVSSSVMGNCSKAHPCICQKIDSLGHNLDDHKSISDDSMNGKSGATIMSYGASSTFGGGISCMSATSLTANEALGDLSTSARVVQLVSSSSDASTECSFVARESTLWWSKIDRSASPMEITRALSFKKVNTACFGPGLYLGSGTKISNSVAYGVDVSRGGGGAIAATNECDISLEGVTISENTANGTKADGGAIWLGYNSRLTAKNSVFVQNSAVDGSGAAIACYNCGHMEGVFPRNRSTVVLSNNTAGNAGAPPPCPSFIRSLYLDSDSEAMPEYARHPCICPEGEFGSELGDQMVCMSCPSRSSSALGSDSIDDCECYFGTYLTENVECLACPANSQLVNSKGNAASACACNEGYYAETSITYDAEGGIVSEEMSCSKCMALSISPKGSTSSDACKCIPGTYLTANAEGLTCPVNSQNVQSKGPIDEACACIENYYGQLVDSIGSEASDTTRNSSNMVCVRCSEDKAAHPGSKYCLCKAQEYYTIPGTDPPECAVCPSGAICPKRGSTTAVMYAQEGHWQPNNASTDNFLACSQTYTDAKLGKIASKRCCSPEIHCERVPRLANWTTDDQCASGYAGIMCSSCASNFVMFQQSCIPCNGGSPLIIGVYGILAVGACVFIITLIVMFKTSSIKVVADETRLERISGFISILVSWLQVLSALTETYNFAWPSLFATYSKSSGTVVNLDFFSAFAISNCQFAIPFINRFLLQGLTPIVLLCSIWLGLFVSQITCCLKGTEVARKKVQFARKNQAQQLSLLLMQLLYPKLAMRSFLMFRCRKIPGVHELLLQADMSKTCYKGVHLQYVPFAVAAVVIGIVGFPFLCFFLLWKTKKSLHLPAFRAKYGDLYLKYEPKWYFWECILMVQKAMLTGAMCAIAPGTPLQLLVAMAVCQLYLILLVFAGPYKGAMEDILAFLASSALTLSLLLGYVAMTDDDPIPNNRHFDQDILGYIMISVNVVPFLYFFYACVVILLRGANYGVGTEILVNGVRRMSTSSRDILENEELRVRLPKQAEMDMALDTQVPPMSQHENNGTGRNDKEVPSASRNEAGLIEKESIAVTINYPRRVQSNMAKSVVQPYPNQLVKTSAKEESNAEIITAKNSGVNSDLSGSSNIARNREKIKGKITYGNRTAMNNAKTKIIPKVKKAKRAGRVSNSKFSASQNSSAQIKTLKTKSDIRLEHIEETQNLNVGMKPPPKTVRPMTKTPRPKPKTPRPKPKTPRPKPKPSR